MPWPLIFSIHTYKFAWRNYAKPIYDLQVKALVRMMSQHIPCWDMLLFEDSLIYYKGKITYVWGDI